LSEKDHILIAPLNWGLGHATRCIPLIRQYLSEGQNVSLASDGDALSMLKKEFPHLVCYELPSYGIRYPKRADFMEMTMISQLPKLTSRISQEKKALGKIIEKESFNLIISDNRYGIYHDSITSVIICHQLNIHASIGQGIVNALHNRMLNRFDECWIPDDENHGLSGDLSNAELDIPIQFIGPLSRFEKRDLKEPVIPVLAILSGPEPQRTMLEELLRPVIRTKERSMLIRGVMSDNERKKNEGVEELGYAFGAELEALINRAELVICRSGYSSIMDLSVLGKKAILIPTPGQTEQEYLANHLNDEMNFHFLTQKEVPEHLAGLISSIIG